MAPTPSTRATRSRFSSPMQSLGASGSAGTESNGGGSGSSSRPNAGGNSSRAGVLSSGGGATNAQKALMARWLEPPVQNRPSFEEAGFQRHGVFDGMAPLGSLPKPTILAKRLQSLPEEKLYNSINGDSSPSPHPSSRPSAKQKQKEQQRDKRKPKPQQVPEEDDRKEGLDGPEAQQEQWRLEEEEREQRLREKAEEAERQRQQQEQEKRDREERVAREEKEKLEGEERVRLQAEQPIPSKKIILKRPSGAKKPPTRIIVNTRRATQGAAESIPEPPVAPVVPEEAEAEELDTKSPPKRKTIIVSPKSKASSSKAAKSLRASKAFKASNATEASEAPEEQEKCDEQDKREGEDHNDDRAEAQKEPSPVALQKSAKRSVGPLRSRRSIAAESRLPKEQEQEQEQEQQPVEAAPQVGAKVSPSATQPAEVEAKTKTEAEAEAEPAKGDDDSKDMKKDTGKDKTIQDSEDEADNGNTADIEADCDNSAGHSRVGLVMDSSILPLSSSFNVQRPRSDSNATMVNKEVTDHVVTVAIAEALRHGRYPTAWALRTLYDEQSGDQKFLTMVEDVFQQTADRETVETFVRLVQDKKKEGKKDNQGWRHFVPPERIPSDDCLPGRPALDAPYSELLDLDFAALLDPKKAEMWAMEREMKRQQQKQLEDSIVDVMVGLEDDAAVFRSKSTESGGTAGARMGTGNEEDADAHARKRAKLSSAASDEQRRGSISFTSPLLSSASPAPMATLALATGSHGPAISTFAAPSSATTSTPPTAVFGKPRAYSHATTASIDEHLPSSPSKDTKDIKDAKDTKDPEGIKESKMPSQTTASPKTPTKAVGRGPGRSLGSTRAKAVAATTATAAVAAESAVTPSSSRHHPRSRASSSASSTSSLSSAMSLSPPSKTLRKSHSGETVETDSEFSEEEVANDEGDDAVTYDSTGGLKTSVGWTIDTLKMAVKEEKAKEGKDKKQKQGTKTSRKAGSKASSKSSSKSSTETPKQKPAADRPKSGPGSGRGGRRRGAGRPPKNRGILHAQVTAGEDGRTGAGAGAGADAATPSKAATVKKPAPAHTPTAPTAPTAATAAAPTSQPIATRNRAAKKSPTPSALISPSTSSAHSQPKRPQSHSASHPSHPHNTNTSSSQAPPPTRPSQSKDTPSRSQPKRSSATAAAAAISASAKEAEKARESKGSKEPKTPREPKQQAKGAADMPSVVQEHTSVRSVAASKRARASTGLPSPAPASTPASAGGDESGDAAANEERRSRMRREARSVTNSMGDVPVSYTRGQDAAASTPAASTSPSSRNKGNAQASASSASATVSTPTQRQRQLRASTTTTRTTRSSRKRAFDEIEEDMSPRSASFQPEEALAAATRLQTPVPSQHAGPSAANSSRAGTPGPKAKKARIGPRVKTSPVKKKTGTSAGMPRFGGERGSPVGGIPLNQDDNDDYCASCGGSGDLVCCDGCTLSFHFNCVDPPLHEGRDLPDEWFCNNCISRHNPAMLTRYTGLFGTLLNNMEKKNSSAFRLPAETRDYFEGVKTGADGEYETVVAPGTNRTRKRAGYDEMFDFFRLRDFDNNLVLCHGCNRSAENPNKKNESGRPIIPCAYCSLWWHIDCLDPPLAQPPPIRGWRCPAHADDILGLLPMLGPAHRFRKIKGAPIVKTAYSRGMINNGFIEFASDDESDSIPNNSGWRDPATFGRIQRVSAKSVELDFMEFVRNGRTGKGKGQQRRDRLRRMQERPEFQAQNASQVIVATIAQQAAPSSAPPPSAPIKSSSLLDRQFIDAAQAAQGLASLSSGVDRTGDLINALLQNAEPAVISLMAQSSPLNIESGPAALKGEDLVALQAMRARIDQLLGNHAAMVSRPPSPKPTNAEVAMEDAPVSLQGEADANEGNEEMSLVTDNGDSDMNEDEEPPAIATPSASITAAGEPAAACEGIAESEWAPTGISTGKEDATASFPHQHHLPPVRIDDSTATSLNASTFADQAVTKQAALPSPLTPPATSDVAVDDDDEVDDVAAAAATVPAPTQAATIDAATAEEEEL